MAALKRAAAAEVLEGHFVETSGFYRAPVGRLARTFDAAGSAVPDLIRSSGVPIASESLAIPSGFVELIGAGTLPVPWLAVCTDSGKRLKHHLHRCAVVQTESPNDKAACERLNQFAAVWAILTKNEARWKRAAGKHKESEIPKLPERCVILCREGDENNLRAIFKHHEIVGVPCESLFHAGMVRLRATRPSYGEGWLQGIRSFHVALEGTRKGTDKTPWVAVPELTDAGERAATTAMELMGVGWIPVASPHETQKGSGVYLFRDVSFLDF